MVPFPLDNFFFLPSFNWSETYNIRFMLTISKLQFNGIKYIHMVQLSPYPSRSMFFESQKETGGINFNKSLFSLD